jgi:hypothetical protein
MVLSEVAKCGKKFEFLKKSQVFALITAVKVSKPFKKLPLIERIYLVSSLVKSNT